MEILSTKNAQGCAAQGLLTDIYQPPDVPIVGDYFMRNPNVGETASQKCHDELVRLGMIEEDGTRITPVSELEQAIVTFERDADVNSVTLRSEEVRVAWAMHRMNAYYARKIRDFFVDHL